MLTLKMIETFYTYLYVKILKSLILYSILYAFVQEHIQSAFLIDAYIYVVDIVLLWTLININLKFII